MEKEEFIEELLALMHARKAPETQYTFVYADFKMIPGGFTINWGIKEFGFGVFTLNINDDEILVDTECMSPAFVYALMCEVKPPLLEKIVLM